MSIKDARARAKERGLTRKRDAQAAAENPDDDDSMHASDASDASTGSALLTDNDPTVERRLREYGALVGLPDDWVSARTLEQVRAEIIKTSQNALDLQRARGRLVERKELDTMAARIRDTWWAEVQQISSMSMIALADMGTDERARVKAVIDEQVAAAAMRVKASLTA